MAAQQQPRGAFIVFEGADRAGKSTQCQKLVEHLRASGVAAELWRFPDRTTAIGKMINSYLTSQSEIDDAAVHLLFSANRWEKRWVGWAVGGRGGGARLSVGARLAGGWWRRVAHHRLAHRSPHLDPSPSPPPPSRRRVAGRSCCARCTRG